MLRKTVIAIAAGSALVITSPAIAVQEGSGGIWSKRTNSKAKAKAQAKKAEEREAARSARENSEATDHASVTGTEHAADESVLADASVAAADLPGLSPGLEVRTATGGTLGSISDVVTGSDGSIRLVIVSSADGRTLHLMPNQLRISGGIVTTTQTDFGG